MIVHYLDFQVNRISVYRTSFWDDVRAVFDEVGKNREEILKAISDHSQNFSYDHSSGMDSEENREAAASLARWIRMLTENTKHAIEEDDLWIAFFSGEVKLQTPCQSAIGWDGKVYFIEFHVNDVVVESTQHHDTAWGAVSEAVRRKNDILAVLHCHTNALVFDDKQPDHAPKNRDAAERFDFWMSDFALFQFNPNCIEENEITVCLSCKDVVRKTDPFIMEMSA